MTSLRDVAERSRVPLLTAYRVLSGGAAEDETTRQAVLAAAQALNYRLSITIRDVAALADVSIATVSYVLNDSYPVRSETRERVLQAASLLGYRPNSTARNLQASETRLIGYGWHDIALGQFNPTLDRFVYWMAQAAEARDYHVLTFAERTGVSAYEALIGTNRVDGFVIASTNRNDPRVRYLLESRIPFAAFGRANDEWSFAYVDVDGRCGIKLAVEHLLSLGHRQIAMIGWPEGSLSGDERLRGYLEAMRDAGLTTYPDWVSRTLNTRQDACEAARRLMILPAALRPTALVCVSDTVAIGAMDALDMLGLRVGEDVALTGFDDDPIAELMRPPLTSLRQPLDQIAAQVVDLLIAQIQRENAPTRQLLLAPTLITRASSGNKRE